MDLTNITQNMNEDDALKVTEALEKVKNNQSVDPYMAKQVYELIERANANISDSQILECFVKLCGKALGLNSYKEEDCLRYLNQSRQSLDNIYPVEHYTAIVKIARLINFERERFIILPNINEFFNNIYSDNDFKNLLSIAFDANMTEDQTIEIVKAQYQPDKKEDYKFQQMVDMVKDRLADISEKARNVIFEFMHKNAKLSHEASECACKIVMGQSYNKKEMFALTNELIVNPAAGYNLPTEVTNKAANETREFNDNVIQFLKDISGISLASEIKNKFHDYIELINKVEKENGNYQPNESEGNIIIAIYNNLKSFGKAEILPKHTKACAEDRILQQELNSKKSSMPSKIRELLDMLEKGQNLTPFQTLYLVKGIKKHKVNLPQNLVFHFHKHLEKLDINFVKLAEDFEELICPKMLDAFERLIVKIEKEQYRSHMAYDKVISLTEEFGDSFLTAVLGENRFKSGVLKALAEDLSDGTYSKEQLIDYIRIHQGEDVVPLPENKDAYYVPDTRLGNSSNIDAYVIKTSIANHKGTSTKNLEDNSVYIIEYNSDIGMIMTIFRHLTSITVKDGDTPSAKTQVGRYKKGADNRHAHYVKLFMDKEEIINRDIPGVGSFSTANAENIFLSQHEGKIQGQFTNLIDDYNTNKKRSFAEIKQLGLKMIEPLPEKGEEHIIVFEMFTPGTPLYKTYLHVLANIIDEDITQAYEGEITATLYAFTGGRATTKILDDFIGDSKETKKGLSELEKLKEELKEKYRKILAIINLSSFRNLQQLEATATILTQAKQLTQQVGENVSKLDDVVQKAEQALQKMEGKIIENNEKIKTAFHEFEKKYMQALT